MKEFWKSKTFWFNLLAAAVFVASEFGFADFQADADLMALVAVVVNLALRFVTNEGIALKLHL